MLSSKSCFGGSNDDALNLLMYSARAESIRRSPDKSDEKKCFMLQIQMLFLANILKCEKTKIIRLHGMTTYLCEDCFVKHLIKNKEIVCGQFN